MSHKDGRVVLSAWVEPVLKWWCWVPANGDSEDDAIMFSTKDVEDAEVAAEVYAERLCQGDPESYETFLNGPVTVMVRSESGVLCEVDVRAVQSIDFYTNVRD